jgi:DNA-binding transcriptional ArsR family regulator
VGVSAYQNTGPSVSEPGCQVHHVTDAEIETASQSIRALASPARLRILCLLLEGERSVVEVTRLVRNHTQSSISQHLSFLLKSGIVSNRKYKTQMLYRVNDKRMGPLMELVEQVFCGFPAQRRDGRSVGEMMSSH